MRLSSTLIWYYYVCPRETWLMAHELGPEQEDPFLEIGRLLQKDTYAREKKEIVAGNMKIDLLRKRNGEVVVGEIKKSSRFLKPATMQLAFYLYRLKKAGVSVKGELLIPKEKKRVSVEFTADIESELKRAFQQIKKIVAQSTPPEPVKNKYCTKCAYREFCWV